MLKRALTLLRGMAGRIIVAQALAISACALSLLTPLLLGQALDALGNGAALTPLIQLTCAALLSSTLGFGKNLAYGKINNLLAVKLRNQLFAKFTRLPAQYYSRHDSGELMSIMNSDVNLFRDALASGISYIAETLVSFIGAVVIMLRLDAALTGLLFATLPLMLLADKLLSRRVTRVSDDAQRQLSQINGILSQSVAGMSVISAYSLRDIARGMFGGANEDWRGSANRLIVLKERVRLISGYLSALQLAMMLALGGMRVAAGALTLGGLTSFLLYAQALAGPLGALSSLYVDARAALAAMRRVFNVLDLPEIAQPQSALSLSPAKACADPVEVKFQDVHFAYEGGEEVLRGATFDVPAGATMALVGRSGAGKSTLLKLLTGFYAPSGGSITIAGEDVSRLDAAARTRLIALVSQDSYLFEMSIADNIRCGKPDADISEVIRSAEMAQADDFIRALPQGYDTIVGEGGCTLSGGQRQRISLARAFLSGAPVLLLDEATSALDNSTEALIRRVLRDAAGRRTLIIVAHRLTTIADADRIAFLQDGRVLCQGDQAYLIANCKEYAALCAREHFTAETAPSTPPNSACAK